MAGQKHAVGIDLGTTFSSLAYVDEQGHVEALRLDDGTFQVASVIYFKSADEIVIGNEALQYAVLDASRVARTFKRQMGEKDYRFEVDGRAYRAEELSAMVLKKLLDAARARLGPIDKAVISVPYVFDEARRQATRDAGLVAGLTEVDLIDEPVAAALAYGHKLMQSGGFFSVNDVYADETVLVYDLGGGTFDATVMRLANDGNFTVLATDGDHRLGGENWDDELLEIVCSRYRLLANVEARQNAELMQELRLKTVEAKKTLSAAPRARVTCLHKGKEIAIDLTRGEFEARTRPLLVRTEQTLTEMLERHDLTWNHIDRLLLVGGSSRMPMIRKALETVTHRTLDLSLPPDIAIAQGGALYAAHKAGVGSFPVENVQTVNSHPLGLLVRKMSEQKNVNDVVLPRGKPTRTEVTRTYRFQPGMKALSLGILLGDSPDPQACVFLGKGRIAPLPPDLTPADKIAVTFCFQENGLLHVEGKLLRARRSHAAGEPLRFEVTVDGTMSETERDAARQSLKGINIE